MVESSFSLAPDGTSAMSNDKAKVLAALYQDPKAFECLLTLFAAAAYSPSHASVLNPIPLGATLLDDGECRIGELRSLLDELPLVQNLSHISSQSILWALLSDILFYDDSKSIKSSYRGDRKLKLKTADLRDVDKSVGNTVVFEVEPNPIDEDRFQREKALYGSINAYHGSPARCWFSIISNGLRLSANETYNRNTGRTFGDGIYFSLNLQQALQYAPIGPGWDKSEHAAEFFAVAICEIIQHPSMVAQAAKTGVASTVLVVEHAHLCKVRRLIVWAYGGRGTTPAHSSRKPRNWLGFALIAYLLALLMIGKPFGDLFSSLRKFIS